MGGLGGSGWGGQGGCDRRIEVFRVDVNEKLVFLIFKKKNWGGVGSGGGGGGWGIGSGGRVGLVVGQGGWEGRIEVFVKIKKKILGGWWGGRVGGGQGGCERRMGWWWVRVDGNEELKFL